MTAKKILLIIVIAFVSANAICLNKEIQNGIDCFQDYQNLLSGKKVGIVANHTSYVGEKHAVDFLIENGVNLIRIFAPEHGFRGNADAGDLIKDDLDVNTGLQVISLHGNTKKPSPKHLENIDVLIFDIQDVGVRFYTYISTLHYVMEACAENSVKLIVMDRPNPNAFYTDGPILRKEQKTFVGMHPVPIVYGMTIGEYALMINGEKWLSNDVRCNLSVIPCMGWNREDIVALPIPPSPNLPDSVSIILYPSTCLFEGTIANEGRGTYFPFQVFGHPDFQNMPFSYIPESIEGMSRAPKLLGQTCYGMDLRGEYNTIKNIQRINLAWLISAYKSYNGKESFFIPFFDNLSGDPEVRKAIIAGKTEDEIRALWKDEVEEFKLMREKYLIYN